MFDGKWIETRTHYRVEAARMKRLRGRKVHGRFDVALGRTEPDISNNSHNFHPYWFTGHPGRSELLADGIYAGEIFLCERLANDDDRIRSHIVILSKVTSFDDRYLHRLEILRRNCGGRCSGPLSFRRWFSVYLKGRHTFAVSHRQIDRPRRRLHSRKSSDLFEVLTIERWTGFSVTRFRKDKEECQE